MVTLLGTDRLSAGDPYRLVCVLQHFVTKPYDKRQSDDMSKSVPSCHSWDRGAGVRDMAISEPFHAMYDAAKD